MSTRSRRRRGHIEELPSGSFRVIVYAGTDPLTGHELRLREVCASWDEAEVALTKLQRQVDENRHPKAAISLGEAIERWMTVAKLEATTRDRYEDLVRL